MARRTLTLLGALFLLPGCLLLPARPDVANAYATPGYIVITNKMVDEIETVDELLGLLWHEEGHGKLGHLRYLAVRERATQREMEADLFAVQRLVDCGYSAGGLIALLERALPRFERGSSGWNQIRARIDVLKNVTVPPSKLPCRLPRYSTNLNPSIVPR